MDCILLPTLALDQFPDRSRIIHGRDGSSRAVQELDRGVDAHQVIDGGVDFGWRQVAFLGRLPEPVRAADDLPALDAAPAE